MNSRLFSVLPFLVSLAFIFLRLILGHIPPAASAYNEWFLNCTNNFDCEDISPLGIDLWINERPESCGYPQPIKHYCKETKSISIIEILGAQYEFVGFNWKYRILIIAEIGFSDQFCSLENKKLQKSMYGIIPLSYECEHFQSPGILDKFNCPGTKFGYSNIPFPNASCVLSAVVPISIPPHLFKEPHGLKYVEERIITGFDNGTNVDAEECRNCTIFSGICGYDLYSNQTKCYCKSPSNGFEICLSGAPAPSPALSSMQSIGWVKIFIAAIFGILVVMILIVLFVYYIRKILLRKQVEEIIREYGKQTPKRYGYYELKKMTRSFKHKLGQGGYSIVYKGKLQDGRDVAVKILNNSQSDGKEFINEVASISTTCHVNIVALLGFCYERDKRALIYEYMPRGSLDNYIRQGGTFNNKHHLDWETLYNIVVGIARGLDYLHHGCHSRILHFDIKPHNILLDEDFCPKISDFGLAKKCETKESYVSLTGTRGTPGFIAPEVFNKRFGKVSHKSDVYSYGMLILEMVGQRKNHYHKVNQSSEEYFPDWIYENLKQNRNTNTYWETMTEAEEELSRKMIIVSLCCTQMIPTERPSMAEVIEMFGKSLDCLQIPPKPSLPSPQILSQSSSSLS